MDSKVVFIIFLCTLCAANEVLCLSDEDIQQLKKFQTMVLLKKPKVRNTNEQVTTTGFQSQQPQHNIGNHVPHDGFDPFGVYGQRLLPRGVPRPFRKRIPPFRKPPGEPTKYQNNFIGGPPGIATAPSFNAPQVTTNNLNFPYQQEFFPQNHVRNVGPPPRYRRPPRPRPAPRVPVIQNSHQNSPPTGPFINIHNARPPFPVNQHYTKPQPGPTGPQNSYRIPNSQNNLNPNPTVSHTAAPSVSSTTAAATTFLPTQFQPQQNQFHYTPQIYHVRNQSPHQEVMAFLQQIPPPVQYFPGPPGNRPPVELSPHVQFIETMQQQQQGPQQANPGTVYLDQPYFIQNVEVSSTASPTPKTTEVPVFKPIPSNGDKSTEKSTALAKLKGFQKSPIVAVVKTKQKTKPVTPKKVSNLSNHNLIRSTTRKPVTSTLKSVQVATSTSSTTKESPFKSSFQEVIFESVKESQKQDSLLDRLKSTESPKKVTAIRTIPLIQYHKSKVTSNIRGAKTPWVGSKPTASPQTITNPYPEYISTNNKNYFKNRSKYYISPQKLSVDTATTTEPSTVATTESAELVTVTSSPIITSNAAVETSTGWQGSTSTIGTLRPRPAFPTKRGQWVIRNGKRYRRLKKTKNPVTSPSNDSKKIIRVMSSSSSSSSSSPGLKSRLRFRKVRVHKAKHQTTEASRTNPASVQSSPSTVLISGSSTSIKP